jgi:hypothetical protein
MTLQRNQTECEMRFLFVTINHSQCMYSFPANPLVSYENCPFSFGHSAFPYRLFNALYLCSFDIAASSFAQYLP